MSTIRYENSNFKQEADLQNNLLDDVNDQMEVNLGNMVQLDTKLKTLLTKTSTCKLWICLLIELVLLIFIVINLGG